MARKKKDDETVSGPVPGTVEYERAAFFAREKAAYEERTGEKVWFELDAPLTSTPMAAEDERRETGDESPAEEEGESQGDDE